MSKWPNLTQQPVEFLDGTPDAEYPIRILQAYRDNCNCRWSTDTEGDCDNPLFTLMNQHCEERAKILDKAIAVLRKGMVK